MRVIVAVLCVAFVLGIEGLWSGPPAGASPAAVRHKKRAHKAGVVRRTAGTTARNRTSAHQQPGSARSVPVAYGSLTNYFNVVSGPHFETRKITHPSTGQVYEVPVCSFVLQATHQQFMSPEFVAEGLDASGVMTDRRLLYFGPKVEFSPAMSVYITPGQRLYGWFIVPTGELRSIRLSEGVP